MTDKAQDFRDLSIEEIEAHIGDTRKEIFEMRNSQMLTKKNAEQPHLFRNKRRSIARALTVINEKKKQAAI